MLTTVETASGPVEGIPARDRSITVFRGIPYAQPPVGELRWRPPQPPERWSGVRRAHRFGPICPQAPNPEIAGVDLPMREDCLSLNVWTGAQHADERRPVLVWIYGGGFRVGTGANPRYDGVNLARKGLVVVTFNYRLGALGFLATEELSAESPQRASGNYGLLDQIAALEWVQRNIAGFGGDPGRVTIAGQSAGAGSVNFLAMSPLAKGLFQRAIAESHARYSRDLELRYLSTSYRTRADAESHGARYAEQRKARSLAQLRALPWQSLIDGDAVDTEVETGSDAKPPLFRPVVDGYVIPQGYDQTYINGLQNDVGYLAGNNRDESGAVPENAFAAYRAASSRARRPGMPPVHVTLDSFRAAAERKFGALADEFLRLYPAATDDEAAHSSNAAVRDNARISTFLWATDWSRHAESPVFTYFWTHRSPIHGPDPRRASHSSEIDYVFGNLDPALAAWSDEDRAVSERMTGYWANYIATGDPNGPGLPHWPAFRPDRPSVMELGGDFQPVPLAAPARLEFWKRFFAAQQPW
ncbi:carboxylesterase family protein [Actinospica sp. MGRD01-02]|uniref:Carboxylic ester hydrolase n=1 Tax=Actinospica acidithermotolerans TaxID=2828514 RepID=A0A941EF45_9ACTN|nr:carboxylesterase family protein [Actinospica acidithermotolerans]MBR7829263.1 carboxylesterase family protein [Actinospica acidithermotolerans]